MDYIIEFSYKDLPIYVVEYTHNKEEIITCLICFTKTEGGTCISQGRTFNTTVNKDIRFQDYGLNFGNIKFYIKKKSLNKKSKSNNVILELELEEKVKNIKFLSKKEREALEEMLNYEQNKLEQDIIVREEISKIRGKQKEIEEEIKNALEILDLFSKKTAESLRNNNLKVFCIKY